MPTKKKPLQSLRPKAGRSQRAATRAARAEAGKQIRDKTQALFESIKRALPLGPNRPEREVVTHPAHYGGDVPHEVIKCLEAWGLELDALLWNAVKYIARSGKKGECLEDLKKAQFYLELRIAKLEAQAGTCVAAQDAHNTAEALQRNLDAYRLSQRAHAGKSQSTK